MNVLEPGENNEVVNIKCGFLPTLRECGNMKRDRESKSPRSRNAIKIYRDKVDIKDGRINKNKNGGPAMQIRSPPLIKSGRVFLRRERGGQREGAEG